MHATNCCASCDIPFSQRSRENIRDATHLIDSILELGQPVAHLDGALSE